MGIAHPATFYHQGHEVHEGNFTISSNLHVLQLLHGLFFFKAI